MPTATNKSTVSLPTDSRLLFGYASWNEIPTTRSKYMRVRRCAELRAEQKKLLNESNQRLATKLQGKTIISQIADPHGATPHRTLNAR